MCSQSKWVIIAVIILACVPLPASAGNINVILSDMDLTYFGSAAGNTGSVYDTIGVAGGNLKDTEADELETAVFELDMALVGTMMNDANTDLYGDLKIDGVGSTILLSTFHPGIGSNGGGFGFDWFASSGEYLRLGIDSVDLYLSKGVFFFTGTATVIDQDLPFGLAFDTAEDVSFSYTATLPGIVGGDPASSAMASGAMTISGVMAVPEPAAVALLGVSVLALYVTRRRRRWRR